MLEIIKLILKAVGAFFGWKEKDRMLNAGNAEQQAKDAKEVVDAITTANKARDEARASGTGATDAGQLPDDGFRRD